MIFDSLSYQFSNSYIDNSLYLFYNLVTVLIDLHPLFQIRCYKCPCTFALAKENKEKYRTIKAQTWPFFCLKLAQQYIVSRKGRVVVILCVPFPCTTTTTTTIEQSNCECCTIQMDCLYLTNFYHKQPCVCHSIVTILCTCTSIKFLMWCKRQQRNKGTTTHNEERRNRKLKVKRGA